MGIWSGIKDDAKKLEEEAVTIEQRVVEAAESLEKQALAEVDSFASTAKVSLSRLENFAGRLETDIASKSAALSKVRAAIEKLTAVQAPPETAPLATASPVGASPSNVSAAST
jgi:hypothetical protein